MEGKKKENNHIQVHIQGTYMPRKGPKRFCTFMLSALMKDANERG